MEIKNISVRLVRGTYLNFRDFMRTNQGYERIKEVIEAFGGEIYEVEGYWRGNK